MQRTRAEGVRKHDRPEIEAAGDAWPMRQCF